MSIENELSYVLSKKAVVCNVADSDVQLSLWGCFL
jgi:hypothetical protein